MKPRSRVPMSEMWRTLVLCVVSFTLWLPIVSCDRPFPPTPTPTIMPDATPTVDATLGVGKLVDRREAAPGDTLHYTLVVMNDMLGGVDPGTSVTISDPLPAEVEFVGPLIPPASYDPSTHTVSWSGQVPQGQSVGVAFDVRVRADVPANTVIRNEVRVTDALERSREGFVETTVLAGAAPEATSTAPAATATSTISVATAVATRTPTAGATQGAPTQTPAGGATTGQPTATPVLGSTVPYIHSMVITPGDNPVYYLVVNGALYQSVNRGQSWSRAALPGVPSSALVNVVAIDYRNPDTMYVGTSQGLYRREGQDELWQLVNTLNVTALAVDFNNSDVLWAGTVYDTQLRAVIAKSEDRGRTWGKADYGLPAASSASYITAILIDPNNPNVMWAHGRPFTPRGWPRGVIYRGGQAGTWEQLPMGAFEYDPSSFDANPNVCFVSGIAYDPNLRALYAGCDISWHNGERVYRLIESRNAGAPNSADVQWNELARLATASNDRVTVNAVRPLAVDSGREKSLFVFVDLTSEVGRIVYRLLVSHDDGRTWTEASTVGLPEHE